MTPPAPPPSTPATARRGRGSRRGQGDGGFTLVELMIAMTIFAVLLSSFGLLFSYSLKAYNFSRARTMADQLGNAEIEKARQLTWDNLGTVSGNPPGTLVANETVTVGNAVFTVTRRVELVDDAVPVYGYNTGANYKRFVVTVTSSAMSKPLQYETIVAPPTEPSLYSGVIRATTFERNNLLPGVTITVKDGPSALRSDLTNQVGLAVFAGLLPTTTAAPYYSVLPTLAGWKLDPADLGVTQQVLAAGQTQSPTFHMYKPVTLTVHVVDVAGNPVTSPTTLTVTDTSGNTDTRSFTSATGSIVMANFGATGDFIPNHAYTFTGSSLGYTTSPPSTEPPLAPANYPTGTDAAVTVTIPIPQRVTTTFNIVDKNTGVPLPGASGTVTGGPEGPVSFASDATGSAVLQLLPAPYTINVSSPPPGYYSYTGTLTVPNSATPITTSILMKPYDPPVTATFAVRNGSTLAPLPSVPFTLSGGPSGTVALTSDALGAATTPLIPGTYTVTVSAPPSGLQPYTGTVTISGTGTSTIDLAIMGSATLRTKDSVSSAALANVPVVLVGPGGTTNLTTGALGTITASLAPGTYTLTVASPPVGYAVYAGTLVVTTGTVTKDILLVKRTDVAFTTTRATDGNNLGNVSVTVSGGPSGTVTFATNGSGTATQSLLPGTYAVAVASPPSGYSPYTGTLVVGTTAQSATVPVPSPAVTQTFRTRQNGTSSSGIASVNVTLTGPGGSYTFTTNPSGGSGSKGAHDATIVPGTYSVSVAPMPAGYSTLNTTSVFVPDGGTGSTIYIYLS